MEIIGTIIGIAIVSFLLALRSMRELDFGETLHKKHIQNRSKGRITFYKDRVVHSTAKKEK